MVLLHTGYISKISSSDALLSYTPVDIYYREPWILMWGLLPLSTPARITSCLKISRHC